MAKTKQGIRDLNQMGKPPRADHLVRDSLQRVRQRLCEHAWRCEVDSDVCRFCDLRDECAHLDRE